MEKRQSKKLKIKQIWTDENQKLKFLLRVWRSFALFQIPGTVLFGVLSIWIFNSYESLNNQKKERILLMDFRGNLLDHEPDSAISSSYIKYAAKKVVNLQENWSYETVEENYKELFREHSTFEFENFLKANMVKSGFVAKIKEHKMVSTFRWDKNKSKATWCSKLQAACALIVGQRYVFEDGNRPISAKKVAYLIISNAVYPTDERPFALRVSRSIIEDRAEDPYSKLEPIFHAAKNGSLPAGMGKTYASK